MLLLPVEFMEAEGRLGEQHLAPEASGCQARFIAFLAKLGIADSR